MQDYNIYMTPSIVSILTEAGYTYIDDMFDVKIKGTDFTYLYPTELVPTLSKMETVHCDYEGYENILDKTFFDYEYLYDIGKVYQMKGKCHKPMRHNVNILSNRIASRYKNDSMFEKGSFDDIMSIHAEWIKPDLVYEKNKTLMISSLYHHMDLFDRVERMIFYLEGEPVGFTLFTIEPKYVHLYFIYSIPTVDYLQDYISWMFFRELVKRKINLPVNFGGAYNDEDIKRDKERLCPYDIRERWSWEYRPDL